MRSIAALVVVLVVGGLAASAASGTRGRASQVTLRLAFTSFPHEVAPHPRATQENAELYVVNAHGSGKRLLARMPASGQPVRVAWSPDGRTVAFSSSSRLLFVNADGSGQRDVGGGVGSQLPIWSPDGHRIALVKCRRGGAQDCDIYVMQADGGGLRRLTRNGESTFPIWSPNGNSIAFSRVRSGQAQYPYGRPEIWVMNADGSAQRRLVQVPGFPSAWSPDGGRVAFVSLPGRGHTAEIYVVNPDGSRQRKLTHNRFNRGNVSWSPDGQKIVFVRARPGMLSKVNDIYVMNPDGSGLHKLTEGRDPRWSPDGAKISFVNNHEGNYEVYVMNADGSGRANVSQNPLADEAFHAWSPK